MHLHHTTPTGLPQLRLRHPLPHGLLAHRYLVSLVQVLRRQRRAKSPVQGVGKDRHRSLFRLSRQFPMGRSPTQFVDYRPVPFPSQLAQQTPHLPLCDADLFGCLSLRDQFLRGLFQGHQPVSFGLGHQ